jgi:hypothetical protein
VTEQAISQERAISIAKELARQTYGDTVDTYDVRVDSDDEQWKIDFVNPKATARGDHFSVWVNKQTGVARLFRGR